MASSYSSHFFLYSPALARLCRTDSPDATRMRCVQVMRKEAGEATTMRDVFFPAGLYAIVGEFEEALRDPRFTVVTPA